MPFLLIAAVPVLFALSTWTGAENLTRFGINFRVFAFPVLTAELIFLVLSFAEGWRPIQQWHELPVLIRVLLGLMVGTAFFSAIREAPYPPDALIWTYISLIHLIFGFSAAWTIRHSSEATSRLIWPAIAIGCFAYACVLACYAAQPHSARFNWEFFGLAVSNIRQIGFYCVVGAVSAIGCATQERGTRLLLFASVAASMFTLACWTGSRGALVASFASVAIVWLLVRRFRTARIVAIFAGSIILGVCMASLLPVPQQEFGLSRMAGSLGQHGGYDYSSGRLQMWAGAWHAILRHPLLGYGEAQFGHVVPQVQSAYMHPHDSILQLLFQWGLVGGGIVLGLVIVVARKLRTVGIGQEYRALPSVLVVTALATYSLYDGVLFHVYPSMMFGFAMASVLTPNRRISSLHPNMNDPDLVGMEPAPSGR